MKESSEFKNKEVINVLDSKRLGFVIDVDINFEKGTVEAIIIPGPSAFFNLFLVARTITLYLGTISQK